MKNPKEVYIVGGPNGAGKTTFVRQFLPFYVNVRNFVNADDIAQGLSPFSAESMNIKSGKLMLNLIEEYKGKGMSFGFETTLAGRKWIAMIGELKIKGYAVYIFFLDLPSVELSVSRIRYRVEAGGHSIPEDTIRRRYGRARINFWNIYKDKADEWHLFDNSGKIPKIVADSLKGKLTVTDQKYFNFFVNSIRKDR